MKKLMSNIFFLTLAFALLSVEAAAGLALLIVRAVEIWLRAARSLREPPPPGGMYGTMARRLRERANPKNGGMK